MSPVMCASGPLSLNFICRPIHPCLSLPPSFPLCCHGYAIPMATGGLYGWLRAPLQRTLWTFLYPFPLSSLTNHTSRIHNAGDLCLDLTPYIDSRASPLSLHMLVMRCTRSHRVLIIFSSPLFPAKEQEGQKISLKAFAVLRYWTLALWSDL